MELKRSFFVLRDIDILAFQFAFLSNYIADSAIGSQSTDVEHPLEAEFSIGEVIPGKIYKDLLCLSSNNAEVPKPGYSFRLILEGTFGFDGNATKDDIDRMLLHSGFSILYNHARGIIAQASAQCPAGKFLLPTVDVNDFVTKFIKSQSVGTRKTKAPRKSASKEK